MTYAVYFFAVIGAATSVVTTGVIGLVVVDMVGRHRIRTLLSSWAPKPHLRREMGKLE